MTAEDRVLSKARKVWQEDAAPSEISVRRGVDQVVRQLRLRKHLLPMPPRLFAASGVMAAFVATLAYAGRGSLLEPVWDALGVHGTMNESASSTDFEAPSFGSPLDRARGASLSAPKAGSHGVSGSGRALPTSVNPGASGASSPGSADGTPQWLNAGPESKGAASSSGEPSAGSTSRASVAGTGTGGSRQGDVAHRGSKPANDGQRELTSRAARARAATHRAAQSQAAAPQPSWSDVNEALAAHDRVRASRLLSQLADHGPDADTRAKALLGIAQLAAGSGDCDNGRTLALEAASRPGIEIKTVRRALELAARCAR
jgi:hypothetical protein